MCVTAPLTISQIEPAVVVDVEPRRAEAGVRQRSQAGCPACALPVDEHARAVVDVQVGALPGQLADEEILVAVVVEVAGVHAHAGLRPSLGADRRAGERAPCS